MEPLAIVFAALLCALAIFQLGLALGAPLGKFAFGGQHEGTLPGGFRIASAFSILIYAGFGVIALDRVGIIDVVPESVSQIGMWVIFGVLAIGTIMNLISRSKAERAVMTPLAAVLAILALLIALGGGARDFSGTVIDSGDGPQLCGIVMESYPPQCGDPTPITGWEWASLEHEEANGVKWGDYHFAGKLNLGTIALEGTPAPGF